MTTLYRKWRPQTFADVFGQERVVRTLQNALTAGRIGHAYLFCGPRGVGKTTTARLLAKAVNCLHDGAPAEAGILPEPDNTCSMCVQITEGRSLDIVEIDAASNGLVEDARQLREQINFAPNEARYKFYILDEAHRLSSAAFDALLKTFEEPPPHVIFVLATTDPNKVPATILSRCQRFDFRRHSVADIRASLAKICAAEGIEAEPAALELLARAADGSSRDSQSLLDQAIAFCGSQLPVDGVRSMLGLASADTIERLAAALLASDARAGLELINAASDAGVDPRGLNRELVEHLRALLLLKVSADTAATLDVAPEAVPALRAQAAALSTPVLVRQIKIFSEADYGFRSALQGQLPLELAFLQAIEAAQVGSVPEAAPAQLGIAPAAAAASVAPSARPPAVRPPFSFGASGRPTAPASNRPAATGSPPTSPSATAQPASKLPAGPATGADHPDQTRSSSVIPATSANEPTRPAQHGSQRSASSATSANEPAKASQPDSQRSAGPPTGANEAPRPAQPDEHVSTGSARGADQPAETRGQLGAAPATSARRPDQMPSQLPANPARGAGEPRTGGQAGATSAASGDEPAPESQTYTPPSIEREHAGARHALGEGPAEGGGTTPSGEGVNLATISEQWQRVLQIVGGQSKNVEALLRSCAPTAIDGATVTLQCEAPFHANKLQEPVNKRMVEGALSRVAGRPCYVKCVVREKKNEATNTVLSGLPDAAKPDENDPLVRAALRMLSARALESN